MQTESDLKVPKPQCSICTEPITAGKAILDCRHIFHLNCFETWRANKKQASCPLCRRISVFAQTYFGKLKFQTVFDECRRILVEIEKIELDYATHFNSLEEYNSTLTSEAWLDVLVKIVRGKPILLSYINEFYWD